MRWRGNVKVFEEIGYEFARFLALFGMDGRTRRGWRPSAGTSEPASRPMASTGCARLSPTIIRRCASRTSRPGRELLLLANLEIGFHEQTRLQPEIVAAMDAPIYDPAALRRRLLAELFPDPTSRVRLSLLRWLGALAPLFRAHDRLAEEFQRLGRLVITEHMMTLRLPGGQVLRLGQDLRRLSALALTRDSPCPARAAQPGRSDAG